MKIVHINCSDVSGGAAIASRRLCEAMISNGIDSKLLVLRKNRNCEYIREIGGVFKQVFHKIVERCVFKIEKKIDPIATYSLMCNGRDFSSLKDVKDADIIFIHWVNGGTLSIKGIRNILHLSKPTYLYMHDMFYITGGCHHSFGCYEFENYCEKCKITTNNIFWKKLSKKQLTIKVDSWSSFTNLHFIAPSSWLTNLAKMSRIAHGHPVFQIPNVIDTNIYKPIARTPEIYGLDKEKFTILFGNASLDSPYKGIRYIVECLHQLDPNKFQCIIIGRDNNNLFKNLPIKTAFTGFLSKDADLVQAYNSCDTMVISSIAENYPNVVVEAMACGKPCIGFNIGGIPDLIINNETGLIVGEISSASLAESIVFMEENPQLYEIMKVNCRQYIQENNSYSNLKQIYEAVLQ